MRAGFDAPWRRKDQTLQSEFSYQRVGIIGAGRTAQAFAMGLAPFSKASPLLYNRSPARRAEALAHMPYVQSTAKAEDLLKVCDLIVMAVSDDAVVDMAEQLAQHMPDDRHPFLFHLSGRCGATVLEPLRERGAVTAAIHPVMTFTGYPEEEVRRMVGTPFAVTGSSAEAVEQAMTLVQHLGGKGFIIAEEKRSLYHAALSHAANHLVTLMEGAARTLKEAGADEPHAILGPLVRAAMGNSLLSGFQALSGPLLRADKGTIRDHLDALDRYCPDVLPDYRSMALATLREMERNGMEQADAMADLQRLLEG